MLDFDCLAAIYLNELTNWNDYRIKNINPALSDVLPDKPITVFLQRFHSEAINILTIVLSATSPEFAALVLRSTYGTKCDNLLRSMVVFR